MYKNHPNLQEFCDWGTITLTFRGESTVLFTVAVKFMVTVPGTAIGSGDRDSFEMTKVSCCIGPQFFHPNVPSRTGFWKKKNNNNSEGKNKKVVCWITFFHITYNICNTTILYSLKSSAKFHYLLALPSSKFLYTKQTSSSKLEFQQLSFWTLWSLTFNSWSCIENRTTSSVQYTKPATSIRRVRNARIAMVSPNIKSTSHKTFLLSEADESLKQEVQAVPYHVTRHVICLLTEIWTKLRGNRSFGCSNAFDTETTHSKGRQSEIWLVGICHF